MKNVIHIGASIGEIDFYEEIGCKNLTYVEPDKEALIKLQKNASKHFEGQDTYLENIKIIPKACTSESGKRLTFFANGHGQSSLEKPGPKTTEFIGDEKAQFQEYEVESITLREVYEESLKDSSQIDYLCIDVQGHEKSILCSTPPQFLSENFSIIDVEIMTDSTQYDVNNDDWQHVIWHLIISGFIPLIYPQAFTESYIFLNRKHGKWIENVAKPISESIARYIARKVHGRDLKSFGESEHVYSHVNSRGVRDFLPLGSTGGSIYCTQIQRFREEFIRRASIITPAEYERITS